LFRGVQGLFFNVRRNSARVSHSRVTLTDT
jgi:hypothetical protein